MKKVIILLFIAFLNFCSNKVNSGEVYVVTSYNVLVFEKPYFKGRTVFTLKKDDTVEVFCRSLKSKKGRHSNRRYRWYYIKNKNHSGWIFGEFLKKIKNRKSKMVKTFLTDDEYNTYINEFKKYIINEFVFSIEFEDEFESKFRVDKDLNVEFFPGGDSFYKNDNKPILKGKLQINYEENKFPQTEIKLDSGKKFPLSVIYNESLDQLEFKYFLLTEEFIKFKEGLEKDASTQ